MKRIAFVVCNNSRDSACDESHTLFLLFSTAALQCIVEPHRDPKYVTVASAVCDGSRGVAFVLSGRAGSDAFGARDPIVAAGIKLL